MSDVQVLRLYQWMIAPQRVVVITPTNDGYSLSWNTEAGDRLRLIGESLEDVLVRAYSLETDACNREELLRKTFNPSAEIRAWTTGLLYNGRYGWRGRVQVASPIPADAKFPAPFLPRGWKWERSIYSNIKRQFKPSSVYGYLSGGDEISENVIENGEFHFQVSAPHRVFIKGNAVLDAIQEAVGEFERNHFIIS